MIIHHINYILIKSTIQTEQIELFLILLIIIVEFQEKILKGIHDLKSLLIKHNIIFFDDKQKNQILDFINQHKTDQKM